MTLEKAGINLTLQGEAEYIAGLRAINNETRLLATETKLAVAQLGQGATPTQKFSAEMKHLGAEIQQSQLATKVLRNRYRELPGEMSKGRNEIERLTKATESQRVKTQMYHDEMARARRVHGPYSEEVIKATRAHDEQKEILKELEGELKETTKAYDGMSVELENMPNDIAEATLASQELLNQQAKLRQEYIESGGVFASFADTLDDNAEKLHKTGEQLTNLGDKFMGLSMGIIAGGGGALKVFMDWETALRGAMKTNDEVVDSNGNVIYSYRDLEDEMRQLSKTIPVSGQELAELAEIAGRLQVPTDEVVEFTEVVAKLGKTTNLTSEEAAEQLGKFINITGATTSETLNLANALVELGNNTAASEQETLRMSTRWASTGKIIGMTDDQILGLSASVISLGIRTEAGKQNCPSAMKIAA